MSGKWLANPADIERLEARLAAVERDMTPPQSIRLLEDRIAAIERELPSVLSLATNMGAEMRRLDGQTTAVALEIARVGRRVEALRRLVRHGGSRLERVTAATATGASAMQAGDDALARLKASLAILEHRIGSEAEQARRSATGLFERIEALRRDAAPGETRDADPPPA